MSLLSGTSAALEEKKTSSLEMIDCINQNRDHLLSLARKASLSGEQAVKLKHVLERPLPEKQGLEEKQFLLGTLFDLGRFAQGYDNDTGFVEDEAVISVLSVALGSSEPEIRRTALIYLLEYAKTKVLEKEAPVIKAALNKFEFPDDVLLRALLPLDALEKAEILMRTGLPAEAAARLGRKDAEQNLIREFEDAANYQRKRELTRKLGYVASAECARTLIKSMGSRLLLQTPTEHVSIACDIILALGRIHPDQPLLTRDIRDILRLGQDRYGIEKVKEYQKDVLAWAKKTYQASPAVMPDVLCKKFIIKRPSGSS